VVVESPTWLACWQHFKPEQKDSRLEVELRAALRSGRPVVATGAAAAYCAAWSLVTREEIQRAQRNPRHEDPNLVANGLAFAEGWMIDTSGQEPGGAARLLRATTNFGNARALYLSGPVAWIVRGDAHEAEIAGSGCAAVFDLAHARRSRGDLKEGRLLLLRNGDRLRFEKELEALPANLPAREPPGNELRLPFEALPAGLGGIEYRFDWIVQR
jgi:cyanophycinase-like exopeptidase